MRTYFTLKFIFTSVLIFSIASLSESAMPLSNQPENANAQMALPLVWSEPSFANKDSLRDNFEFIDRNIISIAIMGDHDHRELVSKAFEKVGLTYEEFKQSMSSTGIVSCLDSGGKRTVTGAVVVESKNLLFANSHTFGREDDKVTMKKGCYFVNYANPKNVYPIDSQDIILGWKSSESASRAFDSLDWAFVRLKTEVVEATPYRLDWSPSKMEEGEKLIALTATYDFKSFPFIGLEPKVQSCFVLWATNSDFYETTCDGLPGDSAGINLTRRINGQLVLRGLHTSEMSGSRPHCTPVQGLGDACASGSVQLAGPALRAVLPYLPK